MIRRGPHGIALPANFDASVDHAVGRLTEEIDRQVIASFPRREPCLRCGATSVTNRHCKVVCDNCGATQDCSDLFPL